MEAKGVKVQDEVNHWYNQLAKNELWSVEEQKIILETLLLIVGKNKKDALEALQRRINALDGLTLEATFARSFKRHLK